MKIVFIGDSLTQGVYGANYVNKVAEALRGHHFINEGVSGDTSLNLYRRLERDVISHQPDGVFIMIGVNDALSATDPSSRLYFRLLKRVRGGQITPIAFRENLRAVLMQLTHHRIRAWVALPPVENRPQTVEVLRQMNAYARVICDELHVPMLDLMAKLTPPNVPDRPPTHFLAGTLRTALHLRLLPGGSYDALQAAGQYTYTFDGIHLTESGARQVADEVAQFLRANGVSG